VRWAFRLRLRNFYLSDVLLLPLLLLMSDMGDMQEERPEMLEMPESEWE
jgi:hypothetical protein